MLLLTTATQGFPEWVRATHWINVLFLGFLIRAGIQILGAYPRLYWNEHCTPGTEWLKFTRKKIPRDRLWVALEQEEDVPAWLGQPGGNNLGLGRHWHFFAAMFWVINGVVYVTLLFTSGAWSRLVPTSWSIVPGAYHTFTTYITLHRPAFGAFHPFDPLQQLAYFGVIFILAPFLILTGLAQSPAIEAQFPWYAGLFGGRQRARSLHFLGLVAFLGFTIVHTALVAYTSLGRNLSNIVIGDTHHDEYLAVLYGVLLVAGILVIYALTSWWSRRQPRQAQRALGAFIGPPLRSLSLATESRQRYSPSDVSPYFIVNGYPPSTPEYLDLQADGFRRWDLEVHGLVDRPLRLSLDDLKGMPQETQITKHHCIQGWSGIAAWRGVPLRLLLREASPTSRARYLILYSYQLDMKGQPFYEALDIRMVDHPQTLLALEMNGQPLDVAHGAPLRLRVETQLGFKMVKWLRGIELVEDYRSLRGGQGGSREDNMYYEQSVSI